MKMSVHLKAPTRILERFQRNALVKIQKVEKYTRSSRFHRKTKFVRARLVEEPKMSIR